MAGNILTSHSRVDYDKLAVNFRPVSHFRRRNNDKQARDLWKSERPNRVSICANRLVKSICYRLTVHERYTPVITCCYKQTQVGIYINDGPLHSLVVIRSSQVPGFRLTMIAKWCSRAQFNQLEPPRILQIHKLNRVHRMLHIHFLIYIIINTIVRHKYRYGYCS